MSKVLALAILLMYLTLLAGVPSPMADASSTGDVAVIVNVDNPISNVSWSDLQKIVMGERKSWNTSTPVQVMMRAKGSYEREIVLARICKMNDSEYKRFWTEKISKGEATAEPVTLPSVGTALDFVASIRGGISFVDPSAVSARIKVLKIDGHLPGESGYTLR